MLFTFNVNGLGSLQKRKDVFYFLGKQNGNTYFLQETHWKSDTENVDHNRALSVLLLGRTQEVREQQFYLRTALSIKYIVL